MTTVDLRPVHATHDGRVRGGAGVQGGGCTGQHQSTEAVGDEGCIRVLFDKYTPAVLLDRQRRTAAEDGHIAVTVHGGRVRHTAVGDGHMAPTVNGGRVRHAARVDIHNADVVHNGHVRHAAVGNGHMAVTVHGGRVSRAAQRHVDGCTPPANGGFVRHTAAEDGHIAVAVYVNSIRAIIFGAAANIIIAAGRAVIRSIDSSITNIVGNSQL